MTMFGKYQHFNSHDFKKSEIYPFEPMVRNSFVKLLHSFLLHTINIDKLYQFYQCHSSETNSFLPEKVELLHHLWDERCFTPSFFVNKLLKNSELLFIEQSRFMYPLFNDFLSTALTAGTFLSDLQVAIFQLITSEIDIRKHLLHAVNCISSSIFSHAICNVVSSIENEHCNYRVFSLLQGFEGCDEECILDVELTFASFAKILPVFFCLPPFSICTVLFEEQRIESRLLDPVTLKYEDGKCYINGDEYGEYDHYSVIVAKKFPELGLLCDKDPLVTYVKKDFYCPIRKRIILRKNTVYGSPISIISIFDDKLKRQTGRYDAIIQNDTGANFWFSLEKKQTELVKLFTRTMSVLYDPAMQMLFIDQKPVVGGVQAKILNMIFKCFVQDGRNVFEWRDFAAFDELICDPYSTGLSTRLKRLITALDKLNCGCKLTKCNRGKYRFICDGIILYEVKS